MDDDEPMNDDELKFDNELKKLKLRAENGAVFFDGDLAGLPPEVEAKFLDNIMAFEKASTETDLKSVREVLDFPKLKPLEDLDDESVSAELEILLDMLMDHRMSFDTLYPVDDKEVYRFITEELMDEMVQVLDVDGFFFNLIYEDFYPNPEEDVKSVVRDFIGSMALLEEEGMVMHLVNPVKNQGYLEDNYIMESRILEVMRDVDMEHYEVTFVKVELTDDAAEITCEIEIESKFQDVKEVPVHIALFGLEYDSEWLINRFDLPSFGL